MSNRSILAALWLALALPPAHAATRIYLMRGIIFGGPALQALGARLRAPGRIVIVGAWTDRDRFEADALSHPRDRIVLIGHSAGARAAADIADDLAARGIRARVIGIDPLLTNAAVNPGIDAVNFCDGCGFKMAGARNINVPSTQGHVGFVADPRVQRAVIAQVGR
jgi:hypothetical protein